MFENSIGILVLHKYLSATELVSERTALNAATIIDAVYGSILVPEASKMLIMNMNRVLMPAIWDMP